MPWLLALAAYLFAFGHSVVFSVAVLVQGYPSEAGQSTERSLSPILAYTSSGLLLAAAAVLMVGPRAGREWLIGRPQPQRGAAVVCCAAVLAALLAGNVGMLATGIPQTSATTADPGPLDYQLVRGVAAAVGEEFIVLALPVVLIRHTAPHTLRRSPVLIGVVSGLVFLRMAYHLYYQEWALALLPWAVLSALVYLWFGRVWPLVAAHAGYNVSLALADHGWLTRNELLVGHLLCSAAGLIAVLLFLGNFRTSGLSQSPP